MGFPQRFVKIKKLTESDSTMKDSITMKVKNCVLTPLGHRVSIKFARFRDTEMHCCSECPTTQQQTKQSSRSTDVVSTVFLHTKKYLPFLQEKPHALNNQHKPKKNTNNNQRQPTTTTTS
eukprot:m.260681 g.260681  ORF g.260681 m.260681 type:complete len:120 (-) comp40436_c0_seq1:64-423(-)